MENGQKQMDSIYSRIPKKTLIYTKKLEDILFFTPLNYRRYSENL
ncbi:hypothetical protein J2Y73_003206 [Peribacillus frigoritolerans]|nr:hypothetical protein [Peribacillus frigoritolerans]